MTFPAEKEQMVLDNMGLVKSLANRMTGGRKNMLVDFDDLVQVGSMGLMHAAKHFDESRGCEFSTYAYRTIKGYMMREYSHRNHVRVPIHVVDLAKVLKKREQTEMDTRKIAELYGVPHTRVLKALYYLSLNTISADRSDGDYDEGFYNLHGLGDDYSNLEVEEFLKILKPRYRFIVESLLGEKTYRQIGLEMGISYQRVGAIVKNIPAMYENYLVRSTR
jgi:DNA-directed RNA polymerase specialized sigma subunit